MNMHTAREQQNTAAVNTGSGKSKITEPTAQLLAERPGNHSNMQEWANNSARVQQQKIIQAMADTYAIYAAPVQRKENKTGLPANLKSGVESLSGHSLDDVKVHYNSAQPAQLNAHAFAQGTDIHIASGQEKHLLHEAWHVVQQKQGRVKPTLQLKGGAQVNNNPALEKEADVMGQKAQLKHKNSTPTQTALPYALNAVVQNKVIQKSSSPPAVNFTVATPVNSAGPVAQLKWVDDGGKVLAWDQLMDGVQWFFVKETEEMFYKIADPSAIQLGDLESYAQFADTPKPYEFWRQNSVLDLDIGSRLDPSVIKPNEVVKKVQDKTTGMEASDKGTYLQDAKTLETNWGTQTTEKRAESILIAVNKYLTATGAPPVAFTLRKMDEDSYGSFSESTWSMELNSLRFAKDTIDQDTMAQIADTVFHEARHAEQFFRIARLLAGMGLRKGEILSKMTIEGSVVDGGMVNVALSNPMLISEDGLSTEVLETLNWYQSFHGGKSGLRIHTIRTMKQAKLQCFELLSIMQQIKLDFSFIKDDIQTAKFAKEEKQLNLKFEHEEVVRKLTELGDVDTEETTKLKETKTQLELAFKKVHTDAIPLFKELQEKQLISIEKQKKGKRGNGSRL